MNPIVLFFVQVLAWFGLASLIRNAYLTPWIACPLMATPLLISSLAWRLPSVNWNWPFARVRNDSVKVQFRRRIGLAIAIAFVFGHLVVSHAMRRVSECMTLGAAQDRFEEDASHLSDVLSAFPSSHGGKYPKSLADLRGAGDSSAPSTTRCQYFASELTPNNLGPLAILFGRRFTLADELPGLHTDDADPSLTNKNWLLYTTDGRSVWITERQFNDPVYQTAFLEHRPIPLPITSFEPN